MSGLVKQKRYDWKDSNLALFGSDTEKQIKKESAEQEPAWNGSGRVVGLQIWRIVNFKVCDWPKEDYGSFFSGDSYIILNTYKANPVSEELSYDVHFWIGSKSTQDEYGTAAYKTVELDTYLGDKPVQHREVEGHESKLFKSYFKKGIIIMEGGAESGFRHVEPEKYKHRLLHFRGDKHNVFIKEVPCCKTRLRSDDVFILDLGTILYQWNGRTSNKHERVKAMLFLCELKTTRGKAKSETIDEEFTSPFHPFYKSLNSEDDVDEVEEEETNQDINQLYRVSDSTGELTFSKVRIGHVSETDLDSGDVFVLDTGKQCFVWIGCGASDAEKQNGFQYAHQHLMTTIHPLVPIVVVKEGQNNSDFQAAVAA